MGKRIDALLGRITFKASKIKPTINLAISRLSILKNQRQARHSISRSDVVQLLNLGHHDRALLRVEQVIKEQNMLDVFVMIEGYCHLLIERDNFVEKKKVCPDEMEVISSLIYAAARCGEFPELQEIRSVFTSWFGKDFAARATELRSCGVNRKMVQKLSTRQPSSESRLRVLKEIASDNGISLQNEEGSLLITEEKLDVESRLNQPELDQPMNSGVPKLKDNSPILPEDIENEGLSDSMKGRRKYRDVAHAAHVAFESAAYAATAARAAVELSRSESYDPDDQSSPDSRPRNMFNTHEPIKNKLRTDQRMDSQGIEDMNVGMEFENFHSSQTYHSVSDDEETQMDTKAEGSKQNKNTSEIKRSLSGSSSDSADKILKGATFSPYIEDKTMAFGREMDFDGSDDENDNEQGGIS